MTHFCSRTARGARLLALAVAVVLVGACTATANRQIETLKRPSGDARIVLMPLDVELVELSASGAPDPRADWTDAARAHLLSALRERQRTDGLKLAVYDEGDLPQEVVDRLHQIQKLHGVVGSTILVNGIEAMALPTKKDRFDWSLGPAVGPLREATGADYALFTYIRDSYSSAGRVALMIVAGAFGVSVPGGAQVGFASLVDLRTGDIVWFNRLQRGTGDLRTAEAARETATVLLTEFPR
ncbi:hypothetical protein [Azospirillum sp. ST 5-10]|uniref:hypothetical protein n=1 Tax=unclassified Azospirillum TaxID=2630922 RepID=UPI003F4A2D37